MRISPPTKVVLYSSAVVAVVGLIFSFVGIDILQTIAPWVVFFGYVLLFLGNVLKGF